MNPFHIISAAAAFATASLAAPGPGGRPDIRVLSTNALAGVMPAVGPLFERATGHRVTVSHSPTKDALERIRRGEAFDLAILTRSGIDELAAEGVVARDTMLDLGRTGLGVGVRTGAPKPDIGTVEGFTRAILGANCVAYSTAGASGLHFAAVLKRLGIEDRLRNRVVTGGLMGHVVLRGEADLAVQMVSELLAVEGIDLVGPFPPEVDNVMLFATAVSAKAAQPGPAASLARFLKSAEALAAMQAKGLTPA